jgi:hypothetical protein
MVLHWVIKAASIAEKSSLPADYDFFFPSKMAALINL